MKTGQLNWNINTEGLELFFSICPDSGDPLCLCSKCRQVIGAPEDDERWAMHDEDSCTGCDTCTPPIRLWKTADDGESIQIIGEYRFHKSCFEQVVSHDFVQQYFVH